MSQTPVPSAKRLGRSQFDNDAQFLEHFVHWFNATDHTLTLIKRGHPKGGDEDMIQALAHGAQVMLALFRQNPQLMKGYVRMMESHLPKPLIPSPEVEAAFEERAERLWRMQGPLDPDVIRGRR